MQKNCELAEMVFVDGEMVGSSPLHHANPLGLNCSQNEILPLPGALAFPLIDFLVFRLVLSGLEKDYYRLYIYVKKIWLF